MGQIVSMWNSIVCGVGAIRFRPFSRFALIVFTFVANLRKLQHILLAPGGLK